MKVILFGATGMVGQGVRRECLREDRYTAFGWLEMLENYLVEQRGIEPLTSALRTRRSAKLSYCPTSKTLKHAGFNSCL